MIGRWFPWRWLVRRAARTYGILDPFMVLARLRKFAEPSEIEAPLELVRAWTVFQARGIVNTRAIQHNLDWVWPYWVERQFDPRDHSFVPRSFSLSHINLTHRNWTAVNAPDSDSYALVDPRGLVTPLHDGWSLDAWIVSDQGRLVPSRCDKVRQTMKYDGQLAIETRFEQEGFNLTSRAEMQRGEDSRPALKVDYSMESDSSAVLCVVLRPYNPEGIQFIDSVTRLTAKPGWQVNGETAVLFDSPADRYVASTYEAGDVFNRLDNRKLTADADCSVGMATAAAIFHADREGRRRVSVSVPIEDDPGAAWSHVRRVPTTWEELDAVTPDLKIPDQRMTGIYHAAVRTLLSLSAGEVYPGSYTYRRFWFRDACIMLNALATLNHMECCRRAFAGSFVERQTVRGFFQSQAGEWDSNGQVLWLAERYSALARERLPDEFVEALRKGADWICRKRQPGKHNRRHPGLLPPGFSAEHLGPNNFYYWDNFWALAGLEAAAGIFRSHGDAEYGGTLSEIAREYRGCIMASIDAIPMEQCLGGIPAAPGRRMDAGAVGSLVADYPLRIFEPKQARIVKTVEFLLDHCMIDNGFFHDMTHSGINPYLTLHLAQVLLRGGDGRYAALVNRVAELASPTGQWPEAVHPLTSGGCMGDGQHGWAAAEWVLMIRNMFVREEDDRLVVGSGLFPEWLDSGEELRFGPTGTRFGKVNVRVQKKANTADVVVEGGWHDGPPKVQAVLPGETTSTVSVRTTARSFDFR